MFLRCFLWKAGKEAHMARNWEQPLDKYQQGIKALSPTALKKLTPDNNHVSLKANPSPSEPSDKTTILATT